MMADSGGSPAAAAGMKPVVTSAASLLK